MISFRTDQEIEAHVTAGPQGFRYRVGPYGSQWYRRLEDMEAALAARFPHAKLAGAAAGKPRKKEQKDEHPAQPVSRPRGRAADVGEREAEAGPVPDVPGQRQLFVGKPGGRAAATAAKAAKQKPKPAPRGRREQAVDRGRDRGRDGGRRVKASKR